MTKTRSRIKFVLIVMLIAIGLFLMFGSFVIPTTNTTYRGFVSAINYGYDISGGRLAVYEVSEANSDEQKSNLSQKLDKIVGDYSAVFENRGLTVTRQGDNIRVEVSNYDEDGIENIMKKAGYSSVNLFSLIGSQSGIVFSSADSFDNISDDDIDGSYIKNCTLDASQAASDGTTYYPITIHFTEEGQTKFKALTKKIVDDGGRLYMYVNGTNYLGSSDASGMDVQSAVSNLTLTTTSQNSATALMLQVSALAKPLLLTQIVDNTITGGLDTSTGAFIGNTRTMLIISLCAIFAITVLFLCVKYRMLGLFATLSLLVFGIIYSFLLQSISLVLIDINGLMGVLLTYILLVCGFVEIFGKIREEYASGKKIPNSVQSGFRKSVLRILEKYAFLLVLCVVVYLVGTSALKHLSIALFVGLFANYFTLFVSLRFMCKTYLPLNSTKKGFYNLKREVAKDEI